MSWESVKLGDCCEITSSKRIFYSEYVEDGVPFYRSKEIIESSQGQQLSEPLFISEEKYNEIKNKYGIPIAGDMLLTSVGTIGIPYIVKKEDYFYFKDGNLTWFRNFKDKLISRYLYYWVKSDKGYATLNNTTIGSSQKALTISALKSIEILVPPIVTQHRIADILSAYDDLIDNNQKQIKLLEEAAQRLYKEWFVDLRFLGHENTKVVDGVPEGWEKRRIEEFGEVITGKTPSTTKAEYYDGNISFVTIPDMHNKVYPLTTEKNLTKLGADTQKNKYLPAHSVIVSCIATVGLVNITVQKCQTNQQINAVVLKNEDDLYFFYESMKRLKEMLGNVGSNGATMTNVNKTKFSNLEILYPTTDVARMYYKFCKPLFENIFELSKAINAARQARDRLLPKLMSGELEV